MLRPVPDPSDRDEHASCPLGICEGNGWILQEDNTTIPCDCRERQIGKATTRGINTRLPERYVGVGFDRNPIAQLDRMVLQHVRRFVDDLQENLENGRGLWFYGDVGTGKTSLAMLIADRALKHGFSVAIYSIPRLFNELRGTYDDESRESFLGLFGKLCSVDLLILDDLGAERQTDWVLEQLYSIVNERWQNQRSIIVTSNVPTDQSSRITLRLQQEIDELHELGQRQARARELASVIARMEALKNDLGKLEVSPRLDPILAMREQIGPRTISRLFEICDDPIPIMGPDLRVSSAG